MNYSPKFDYKKLPCQTRTDGIRHYETPLGWVPSVTTILSQTGDKTALDGWKKFVGEKKADEIRDQAAALGSVIHEQIENYAVGRERSTGSNYIYQLGTKMTDVLIENGFNHIEEIWAIEEQVYVDGLYAGTADLIGILSGRPSIMDWKNTIKMKKREHLDGYFLQGTAYLLAHNQMFGTKIDQVAIMMVDRKLNFERFVLEGDELELTKTKWIERLETFFA